MNDNRMRFRRLYANSSFHQIINDIEIVKLSGRSRAEVDGLDANKYAERLRLVACNRYLQGRA